MIQDDGELIATRIRWWRIERRLTQRVLADRAGLDRSYITKIEAFTKRVDSRSTLERIAHALGVSYSDLTGQPIRPETRHLQATHAGIERIRVAHVSMSALVPGPAVTGSLGQLAVAVGAAERAWHDCDYAAATRDLGRVLRDLHSLCSSQRDALPLLVRALDVAAWSVRVVGMYDLAYSLSARQAAAAAECDDPSLAGLATFTHAMMVSAASSGDATAQALAQQLAVRQIDLMRGASTPAELQVLGMLHLAAARAEIGAGGTGDTFLREAQTLADRTGEGDALGLYFGPTNVAIWRIHFAVERQQGGRVGELAQHVHLAALPSVSRQAMFYRHLGLGYSQERGREAQTIAALLKSERLAPGKLRLDPLARDAIGQILNRARASAGGTDLIRLARHAGLL